MFKRDVALIGIGRWGKNLARNLHALEALHTICDTRETTHDVYQSLYPEVMMTTNFQSVLDNPEITRLVIAAPAELHYTLAKKALLAGKDIYVEKPLCLESSQGEELVNLADEKGCVLMCGHLLQYHPCVRKMLELVKDGAIGKLQYISSNRLNLGPIRQEENALWNFAPHDLSVILALCGGKLPNRVQCVGGDYTTPGVADLTITTLRFDEGVRAHVYVSWLNPYKEQKLVVVGSTGMLVFDDTEKWENKLILYPDYVKWAKGRIPEVNVTDGVAVEVEQKEPLREECAHFLTCCDREETPLTDGEEAVRVLKVLQAAEASLKEDGEPQNPQTVQMGPEPYFVHHTAVVDKEAAVGGDTKIWHYSHIMDGAQVGKGCTIGQNVCMTKDAVVGDRVKVQNNVSIYGGVVCEDDVFLGPSMVFTNITNPRSEVSRKDQYVCTYVRQGATIGANATVLCGLELGAYCFIGAGAVVTKNVKPHALVVGNPGKQVGWISKNGNTLSLPLSSEEELSATCPDTGEEYRLVGDQLTLSVQGVSACT